MGEPTRVSAVFTPHNIGRTSRTGGHWVWLPDSARILMYPDNVGTATAYLLDPEGGQGTQVPWRSDGDLDWQRTAP
jgi:hypothetical protein